jgi:CO dehydrogenase/acetyl-CoA synthase alpha subunit
MLLALALQVAAPIASPPADWRALPPLRAPATETAELVSDYVRDEVAAGRCTTPRPGTLSVELAVYVAENGRVRRIVPRAINCPTVEQYASGVALRSLRGHVEPPEVVGWHRMTIAFAWQ